MSSLETLLPRLEATHSKPSRWSPRTAYWLIIGLAIVIRFSQLDVQSLTMDEVKDLELARDGWSAIQSSEDRFPPLYHLLLHGWLKVMPWDETGRGLSAVCGVLTVAVVIELGSLVSGPHAGLWAGAIAALAPFMTWYSVESRAYGLYLLLGAIAIWQFTAATTTGSKRHWFFFAASAIAGVYVHYYFGLLIACAGILFLWQRPVVGELRLGLSAFTLIAIACIPAFFMLQGDLDQPWGYARTSDFSPAALGYTYFSFLSGYTLGPSLRELHTMPASAAGVRAVPWVLLLGSATTVLLILAFSGTAKDRRWIAWFIAFCLAPPAIIGAVSSVASFGYNARHAVWACVPLYVLTGAGMADGRFRGLRSTAAATIALSFGVAHYQRLASDMHRNEDVRSVANFMTAFDEPAPIFVLSGYMAKPLAYYLPHEQEPHPLYLNGETIDGNTAASQSIALVRAQVPRGSNFWLVYSRAFHGDPYGAILKVLKDEYALIPQQEFAGVQLYLGKAK